MPHEILGISFYKKYNIIVMRSFIAFLMILLFFINLYPISISSPIKDVDFQKGISFTGWDSNNIYNSYTSDKSLEKLAETGANYVALTTSWFQDDINSTYIYPDMDKTPTDDSIVHAINKIHSLGMHVMLKPHLRLQNHEWCAYIHFNNENKWKTWFNSYKNFICHYAKLADEYNVEEFCIGVELRGTIDRIEWMDVIKAVRENFSRAIIYAANWDSYRDITFWNKLDYIGIDAYFPLTNKMNPDMQDLLNGWKRWHNDIESYSYRMGKKIIFTEIGYCSQDGTNMEPGNPDISNRIDLQEQADCYNATFITFCNDNFMKGIFWWEWYADGTGSDDIYYTPHGKPAENIIKNYYITKLEILKPLPGRIYFMDREIIMINENKTIVIGEITVEAKTNGDKVEFYMDDNLMFTDYNKPYQWILNKKMFGLHEIKIIAYHCLNEEIEDRINITIFNL